MMTRPLRFLVTLSLLFSACGPDAGSPDIVSIAVPPEDATPGLPDAGTPPDATSSDPAVLPENLGELALPLCDDGLLLDHDYFAVCYLDTHRLPRWVAYHITPEELAGPADRAGQGFLIDPLLPNDISSPSSSDYTHSGYDPGHMAPAADFKRSDAAMRETFVMTNIAPQTPTLNRQNWRLLEEDIREMVASHKSAWVITGHLFLDQDGVPTEPTQWMDVPNRPAVAIPTHYYKTLLFETPDDQLFGYGFILPNSAGPIAAQASEHQRSIDAIEQLSGLDFFFDLPDAIEDAVEADLMPWTS